LVFRGLNKLILNLKNAIAGVTYLYYKFLILVHDVIYTSIETIRGIAPCHPRISISKVWYRTVVHV